MRFEKYVRKPVDVDAVQFNGEAIECLKADRRVHFESLRFTVDTDEGEAQGNISDWIVRGPMGDLAVMTDDIFQAAHYKWDERPCPRPRVKANGSSEQS